MRVILDVLTYLTSFHLFSITKIPFIYNFHMAFSFQCLLLLCLLQKLDLSLETERLFPLSRFYLSINGNFSTYLIIFGEGVSARVVGKEGRIFSVSV